MTFAERFPSLRATVLQDGHIDHITQTARCIVKMDEGEQVGRYRFADTEEILKAGTPVIVDWMGRATTPHQSERTET